MEKSKTKERGKKMGNQLCSAMCEFAVVITFNVVVFGVLVMGISLL